MGKKKPKSKLSKPATAGSESNPASLPKSDIEAIAAAICSANQAVFIKVCRLCESKDGPFLNIFDADKVTAKKIDELMPFGIAENDDLPHKICFRCSAKVEELYEFIQKCIKTQHNLNANMGKKEPIQTKTRTRVIWEEKLNKSNMSNDDICDALIKKAMEGIKDIPLNPLPLENEKPVSPVPTKRVSKPRTQSPKPATAETNNKSEDEDGLKQVTERRFLPTRSSRSQKSDGLLEGLPDYKKMKSNSKPTIEPNKPKEEKTLKKKVLQISSDEEITCEADDSSKTSSPPSKPKPVEEAPKPVEEAPKPVEEQKPFDIMDHVSMIKVNGVGVLFQCRLCNRNFLKKDVVVTHGCAKAKVPKVDFVKPIAQPEPPKITTVKYINTKLDGELGKPNLNKSEQTKTDVEPKKPIIPESKPKPKIGPASKVKRINNHNSLIGMTVAPITDEKSNVAPTDPSPKEPPIKDPPTKTVAKSPPETPSTAEPSVQFPSAPSINSRYKLVPGPNNTFQLVEDKTAASENIETVSPTKKRKNDNIKPTENKKSKQLSEPSNKCKTAENCEVIDLEEQSPPPKKKTDEQPYPVGLFQTLPHHTSIYPPSTVPTQPVFTTPAMKKQSYTIVQTGNPSKLLISTKPQPPPEEETTKKRTRKNKHEVRAPPEQQPFNVTLEDAAHPKDHGFFNFINVDPLLQPSYVLPTDNIIQESQISTSTSVLKGTTDNKEKEKYSCNMCGESFSREKKLLAHIHSHYNKMDEEDMQREKNSKKRRK